MVGHQPSNTTLSEPILRQFTDAKMCHSASRQKFSNVQIGIEPCQRELEQLERLHSEDTRRRPMITHTIESY